MKNIFDYFADFTNKKTDFDEENNKVYNQYMLNRFVSMVNGWIHHANAMNLFNNISNKNHFFYYKNTLPQRFQRVNYLKENKIEKQKLEEINMIERYYEISSKEAKICYNHLKTLNNGEIEKIKKYFESGLKKR